MVLEKNTALREKLSEARVRTVRVETHTVNETPVKTPAVTLDMEIETVETKKKTCSRAIKGLQTWTVKVQGNAERHENVFVAKMVENQKPQPVEEGEFQLVSRKKTIKANDTKIDKLKAKLPDTWFPSVIRG